MLHTFSPAVQIECPAQEELAWEDHADVGALRRCELGGTSCTGTGSAAFVSVQLAEM